MTIAIIVITSAISIYSFYNRKLFHRLTLNPFLFINRKEYWRIFTHGFIHADWIHLGVNMFVLYSFGTFCEKFMLQLGSHGYINHPVLNFFILYAGGILFSAIPSIIKNRNNSWYNSVGASGAVSAIVFATIFFQPLNLIYFYFIPVPGIAFGIIYLAYSQYMAKKSNDNINHEAHFAGALFGFIYPLFMNTELIHLFLGPFGF